MTTAEAFLAGGFIRVVTSAHKLRAARDTGSVGSGYTFGCGADQRGALARSVTVDTSMRTFFSSLDADAAVVSCAARLVNAVLR